MESQSRGEERIANEWLLELGLHFSSRTVGKCTSRRVPGKPRGDQRWATFVPPCRRFLHNSNHHVPAALRRSHRLLHFNLHGSPDGGRNVAAAARSHRRPGRLPIPDPRSGQHTRQKSGIGGGGRNRAGVHGFAGHCISICINRLSSGATRFATGSSATMTHLASQCPARAKAAAWFFQSLPKIRSSSSIKL